MSLKKHFAPTLLALATVGLLIPAPQEVLAATSSSPPTIQDVALSAGGTLRGQILDPQGASTAGATVTIESQQGVVAQTQTDQNGEFAVTRLRGGLYTVQAAETTSLYRFWAEGTAPPRAAQGALLVRDGSAVRGAVSDWGVGGIVVVGVAATIVTLAVRDRDGS